MDAKRSLIVAGTLCIVMACATGTSYGASVNPCSLLTEEQVSAALGVTVGPGSSTMAMNHCQWFPKDHMQKGSVLLSLENEQGLAAAKIALGREVTTVSGVGDDAVQDTTQGTRTVLTVKKGNTYFAIRVSGLPVEQAKLIEKTLAMEIVKKL
jgi:hypothetical protein